MFLIIWKVILVSREGVGRGRGFMGVLLWLWGRFRLVEDYFRVLMSLCFRVRLSWGLNGYLWF